MNPWNRTLLASCLLLLLDLPGQAPAQGTLNICAVDNTLRFIGKDGEELSASQEDNIVKVRIDTATFIRHEDVYYRIFSLSADMGVALRRKVRIESDAKEVGYGSTSQTSSAKQYKTIYADGVIYDMDGDKAYPYEMTEEIFLFKGETVFPLTKKNLRKLFPSKKDEIDAWFKSGNNLPETVEGAMEFLSLWAN
jgi:hypothetical protein